MEGASASVNTIELPTGVKVGDEILKKLSFRELAGLEEDVLASQAPVSQKMTTILANCATAFGNLTDQHQIRKAIEQLVITDRWFYLVQLRSLSLGSAYKCDTECPECKAKDKVVIDLTETEIKNPPKADALFVETKVPSGRVVRWKIADGTTEAKIEKLSRADAVATVALFARVTEIDNKPVSMGDLKSLPMKDRLALREAIDKAEGEFDDSYNATCPTCSHEYKGELELDAQSFFFPSATS